MVRVELVYFPDCPNVPAARERLREALMEAGLPLEWTEWDVTAQDAPAHARGYGSPTILVDGRDVEGAVPCEGASCRVYLGSDHPGVPALAVLVAALREATASTIPRWSPRALVVVPGALLSVLPVVGCPACWPAYAGTLSALGVPFLMDTAWLLPLTIGAIAVALIALAHGAFKRRELGPLLVGGVASLAILIGKFVVSHDVVALAGTALLVASSLWYAAPVRARSLRATV